MYKFGGFIDIICWDWYIGYGCGGGGAGGGNKSVQNYSGVYIYESML